MANLKEIKIRISATQKTKQITSAMKLVAAAKLKRATDSALAARPYRERLGEVLGRVASAVGEDNDNPLLKTHEKVSRVLVVVLTSDRGLCGAFNNALLRRIGPFLAEKKAAGVEVSLHVYGKKGSGYLSNRSVDIAARNNDYTREEKMSLVRPLCDEMVRGYVDGDYDEVYVVYNRFVNALVQTPTFDRVLPLSVDAVATDEPTAASTEYRYEPSAPEILGALLPLYLRTLVLQSFLETEAGEHAARMTAMDNASRNASDLISRLTLEYNRARQAAITKEIIEIVSGAEAL